MQAGELPKADIAVGQTLTRAQADALLNAKVCYLYPWCSLKMTDKRQPCLNHNCKVRGEVESAHILNCLSSPALYMSMHCSRVFQ